MIRKGAKKNIDQILFVFIKILTATIINTLSKKPKPTNGRALCTNTENRNTNYKIEGKVRYIQEKNY